MNIWAFCWSFLFGNRIFFKYVKRIRIRICSQYCFFPPLMILSHPRIGANVGGTIAAIFDLRLYTSSYRKSIKLTHFFHWHNYNCFFDGYFSFDYIGGRHQSHRTDGKFNYENGSIELLLIVKRKRNEYTLIRYTVWTRVFFFFTDYGIALISTSRNL